MESGRLSVLSRDDSDSHSIVEKLVGPLYLGLVVNYFLWGVQVTQSYHYYRSYRKTDRTWLKLAVGLLFITDLVESVCVSHACWIFLVDGWGDLNKVTLFPGWGFYATPLTDSFTASIVHFFYAQKIWTLLDAPYNHICTIIVLALSLTQLTGGVGGSAFIYSIQMTLPEFSRFKVWASVWLMTAAATDIVITTVMTWKLSRSRTGFKKTDDLITKLIRLTVETGLATAVVQIVGIIVYLVWPLESYHVVLAFVGPKVYSNSMLALLNSRQTQQNFSTLSWHTTSQDRPVDNIHIHTTQTVAISDNYELENKTPSKTSKPRSANEQRTAPDAESYTSLPFTTKGSDFGTP